MSALVPRDHFQTHAWSPLIGREQDLAALVCYLQQERLVTLWGPGGSGKTRLAVQAAQQMQDSFADGTAFVACSDLQDADHLVPYVAHALGFPVSDERLPFESLLAWLRSRHLLLVIDNCEHLLEACSHLIAGVLAACPQVHVLITSRELLNLPAEQAYQVLPLTLPPSERVLGLPPCADSSDNAEEWQATGTYSAIQLFIQRARVTLPAFALTRENASPIATICRLVDGLPLAIELAAARVKMLALEQIAERLAQNNDLLVAGARLAPPRQQTLHATINWSYQLLMPREQRLFRRLALVSGSFDLSLVEALGKGIEENSGRTCNPGAPSNAVDLLGHLIDKSLVTVVSLESCARYRLLDTIRHFGREQSQQLGETESTYHLYSGWVRTISERAESELHGPHQVVWLNRLETEIEHIRTVIGWLLAQGAAAEVVHISAALTSWCEQRAHTREATRWLEFALARLTEMAAGQKIEPALEARALHTLGVLNIRRHHADPTQDYLVLAQDYLARAKERYAELKDDAGVASTLYHLGYLHYWQADYQDARACLEDGLAIVPKEALSITAGLYHRLALTLCHLDGGCQHARFYYDKSLELRRRTADIGGLALTLNNVGALLSDQGEYAQAQQYLRESLQHFDELGDRDGYVLVLVNLYDVALALGDATVAQGYLAAALSSTWAECQLWLLAELFDRLARLALRYHHPLLAIQLCGFAAALSRDRSDDLPEDIWARLCHAQPYAAKHAGTKVVDGEAGTGNDIPLATYTAAWRKGQLMGLEEAFAFALQSFRPGALTTQDDDTSPDAQVVWDTTAESPTTTSHVPSGSVLGTISVDALTESSPTSPKPPLRIEAFGSGVVFQGHSPEGMAWHYSKARELFFYLLSFPYRTRGQICLALWPDAAEEQAGAHMRVTLYHARKTLGDAAWIVRTTAGYAFNRSLPYWYDVEAFETRLTRAQTLQHTQSTQQTQQGDATNETIIALLAEACALYRGEYLADLPPHEWLLQRQGQLQRCYLDALFCLGEAYLTQGDAHQALTCYHRMTACDPYHEQAHAAILRCYVRLGQRSQALRYYRDLRHYLRNELGVSPDPQITAYVRSVLAQAGAAS